MDRKVQIESLLNAALSECSQLTSSLMMSLGMGIDSGSLESLLQIEQYIKQVKEIINES